MRLIRSMRIAAVVLVVGLLAAGAASARVVIGTPRNDRLVGTPQADVIRGLAGRDQLLGGGGADFLQGGPGRDTIDSGPGADRVAVSYDGARDSVRCGSGLDVVNADLTDTVASDCELVGRRLSRDPYRDSEAQHETEVEPDSFTVGRTTVTTFQVGRQVEGASTNIGFAVTTDNGLTWRSGLLPGLTDASEPLGVNERASDPVVAFDARHGTWLISSLALGDGITRLAINRSVDGATWSGAINAAEEAGAGGEEGVAFDKNWVACDNTTSSLFYGRCYLVYTHSGASDMLAARWSDDGGATWSAGVDIGARPAVGAFPVIRPTGELVVAYLWELRGFAVAASRSTDGGATWSGPVRIAGVAASCGVRGFRAFPLPSADVDAGGRVWVTWHDCAAPGETQNSVFVSTSPDGTTWSTPAAVTSGRNALLPAIGIDPATGRAAIAYMRYVTAGMDVELVESVGSGWGVPRRLSAQTMPLAWMPNTVSGRMLGDYISVHYAAGRPLVVWVLANEPVGASFRQAVYATRG
jgi:RTX calcium-binding nonapeptide repeat (4 copies)